MPHTDEEIRDAAERLERRLDQRPPIKMEPTDDLLAIVAAVDARNAADAQISELVAAARARGRSWTRIGVALGVSRQAARERFSQDAQTTGR